MRIVHIVETLERGGLERVVVELCQGQRAAGHEVGVLCLFRKGVLAAELEAGDIGVECIGKRPGLDVWALVRLRAYLRRQRAEVIHAHNAVATYLAAIATLLGRRSGAWVSTRHGMGEVRRESRKERLFHWAAAHYGAVVAVCEAARRQFVISGLVSSARSVVIRNGIRIDEIVVATPAAREQARRALGLAAGAFIVGSVGRLNWAKDYGLMIAAFGRALAGSAAMLVVVGDGAEKAPLQAAAAAAGLAERVRFLGDRSDVPAILPAFDLFCLSSRTEGYSIALLEAVSAGLAVVATDVGGNSEIIDDGVSGLLVPAGDVDALAAALTRLRGDELRARLAQAAQTWALRHAGVDAMVAAYLRLYERLTTL